MEWKGANSDIRNESLRILRAASEAKVALKMLSGLAIKVHSLNEKEFANRLGRSAEKGQEYSDIDFATYYKLKAANDPIRFRDRLEVDPISIPLSDLLLEKLQIVSFSRKDMIDTLLLLKAHTIAGKEKLETISTDRVAQVLSRDWGFWYTVTTNLQGIGEHLKETSVLSSQEA